MIGERCPACLSERTERFLELERVPVHCNVLWPTEEEGKAAPRGDIVLRFCRTCGMVFNEAFEPALTEYKASYENSLHFSPRFQEYAQGLARRLTERYELAGKTVVEIGCGKGEFLELLGDVASAECVGFDPTYEPRDGDHVSVVRDFYSKAHADQPADLIVCRHTLEHVEDPRGFLGDVREAIGEREDVGIFFEVPNALFTLRDRAIWDVIYEHPLYFTPPSLRRLFEASRFAVERLRPAFGEQFLTLEALPDGREPDDRRELEVEGLLDVVRAFGEEYWAMVDSWGGRLTSWMERGDRIALWGAGSKGVTFLNTVPGGEAISSVVDLNPRKHGRWVPGSAQEVVSPEALRNDPPDVVLVMNPVYEPEIRRSLSDLSPGARVVSVVPASRSRAP